MITYAFDPIICNCIIMPDMKCYSFENINKAFTIHWLKNHLRSVPLNMKLFYISDPRLHNNLSLQTRLHEDCYLSVWFTLIISLQIYS